jgi:hypothetical protein
MLQQGVGYTVTNSSGGQSLTIDAVGIYKETLPFFIYEDTNDQGARCFRLNPGTFNNQFPKVNGTTIGEAAAYLAEPGATSVVILTIPASAEAFPAGECSIAFQEGTTAPIASGSSAYVLLGKVTVTTLQGGSEKNFEVSNLASGSLWGERFECGSDLNYWFSRI